MRFIKPLTIAALLTASIAGANASPFNANVSFNALDDATTATVLKVNPAEAASLAIDVDTDSLQQTIQNNRFLLRSVQAQGFALDQIVGLDATDGGGSSVTLYAM
ncbi:MAG: hypothetical protein RLW68_14455 [Devosia marina]|jgi:hypothetical protein|uniref:hypothetical protein n=1 Tax=Devosia marina TaxID=2683198 RepID=UPI0032EDF0A8